MERQSTLPWQFQNKVDKIAAMSNQKKTRLRILLTELKVIIIDEISMVSNVMLMNIHNRLKEIFATPNSKLFGGTSLITVGDLYQLPPIRSQPIFFNYKNAVYNLCHPWHIFKMIELTEVMRQKNDHQFTDLLNRFRTASQTEDDIKTIQSKSLSLTDNDYPTNSLYIWAENKPVDEHNMRRLQNLPTPLCVLRCVDQYPPQVTKHDIENVLNRGRSETGGLDSEVFIKEGARVMLTTNIDIADRLINGQMGTTAQIVFDQSNGKPIKVYVKFDDDKAGSMTIDKCSDSYAKDNRVVPVVPVLAKIKIRPGKASSPEIQRMQFPLTLAWACTVHKVQGLTLQNTVISFELFKQRSFNYGQIYVALSHATSLSGLHIIGKIDSKHVHADPRVHEEYQRLRDLSEVNSNSQQQLFNMNGNNPPVCITLLNVRSLKKHSIDIKHDTTVFSSDVLLLTETQITPTHFDSEIRRNLHPFELYRQDSTDRYLSLAVCFKSTVKIINCEYFASVNAFRFVIHSTKLLRRKTVLLLYRKQSSNINQYVDSLKGILNCKPADIVLGDFNINYFNDSDMKELNTLMETLRYTQIVQRPTFVSAGSLLDHVYIKLQMVSVVENSVVSVYYSDHEAIKLSLGFI